MTGQASPQVWLPASNIGRESRCPLNTVTYVNPGIAIELKKANGDSIIYTPVSIQDRDQFISTFLGCSFDTAGHDTAGNKMGDTFSPYMYSRFQSKSEEMKPLEPSKKRKANDAGEPSVKKGKTDGNPSQGASILVGNLNHNVDNHLLHEKFRSCEGMIRVRIIANRSSQSWYGFVDFQTAEDAKAALEEMQDVVLCGRPLRIEIAQGEKGGKRRARGGRRR